MYSWNKRRRTSDMLLGAMHQPAAKLLSPAPPADGQQPRAITPAVDCTGTAATTDPRDELRRLALEVEPVVVPRTSFTAGGGSALSPGVPGTSDAPPVIGYQSTYRAVLAKRDYLVRNTLGSGSYSKVKKVYCFAKQSVIQIAAVKIIDRQKAPQDYQEKFLPRELKLWPKLRHPNLIALTDCFQDRQRVYMVLEYAAGGDALKHIQTTGAISEDRARVWTSQIASAVRYMHDLDIAHRDLKLENLLIDASDNIKICDFGFVREATLGDLSQTYCGSKSYAAPEILQGRPYDPKKADVWAIAVILYIFVTGKMPYDETKGTKSILEEQRQLDFHWSRSRNLSVACQTLIKRMFTWDFVQRPTVQSVLADSWFLPLSPSPVTGSDYITPRPGAASVTSVTSTSSSSPPAVLPAAGRRLVSAAAGFGTGAGVVVQSPASSPVSRTVPPAAAGAPGVTGLRRCLRSSNLDSTADRDGKTTRDDGHSTTATVNTSDVSVCISP